MKKEARTKIPLTLPFSASVITVDQKCTCEKSHAGLCLTAQPLLCKIVF